MASQQTKNAITLKGSSQIITEYLSKWFLPAIGILLWIVCITREGFSGLLEGFLVWKGSGKVGFYWKSSELRQSVDTPKIFTRRHWDVFL